MEKIKYPIREIDLNCIKSNCVLAVNVSEAEIDFHEKTIRQHGLLTPVVIIENKEGEKITVCGEAEIQALRNMGVPRMDVIVSELKNKGDVGKITLLMSGMKNGLNPITEGLVLKEMMETGGFTQKELALKLRKSQGWISKRLSLAHTLKETVTQMVLAKKICPRSAEEIAKLPKDKQHEFALASSKLKLAKIAIEKLVNTYRKTSTPQSLKDEIITNPSSALLLLCEGIEIKKIKASITSNQKFDWALRLLLKLVGELEGCFADMNKETFEKYKILLGAGNIALIRLNSLINNAVSIYKENSPGNKQLKESENLE